MNALTSRLALVILVLTGVAFAADDAKSKPDAEAIRGKWKAVAVEAEGQKVPLDNELFIEFDADSVAKLKDGAKTDPSDYTLAADKTPKEVDFKPKAGEDAGKTLKGIYELKDDSLKICFAKPDVERPKEIKAAEGVIFATFERVKAAEKK
jgi:uncharacterized protein (TIGR03067 family)